MAEGTGQPVYTSSVLSGPIAKMLGLDWIEVMTAAEISPTSKGDHGFLVTGPEYIGLWNTMIRLSPQANVSRLLGERMASGPAIPVLFAMSSAPNFETGLARLAKHKHLFGPMRFAVQSDSNWCTVNIVPDSPDFDLPPTFSSPQIVYLHAVTTALATRHLKPTAVRLPLPKAELVAMEDLFSCVPDKGAPMLSYRTSDTQVPFISDNPKLWRATENDLETMSSIMAKDVALSERVRASLLEAFAVTDPTLAHISSRLRMSRSSLIRGLAQENTTFQKVLDQTRKTLAIRYLRDSELTNQQIAHLVGYRDTNAFQRAFRKWTGQTPKGLRLSLE